MASKLTYELKPGETKVLELNVPVHVPWWRIGRKEDATLIITNQRIIEIRQTRVCWCCTQDSNIKYVMPNSIKEVGYFQGGGVCCKRFYFYYEAFTQKSSFWIPGANRQEAQAIIDAIYDIINKVQKNS